MKTLFKRAGSQRLGAESRRRLFWIVSATCLLVAPAFSYVLLLDRNTQGRVVTVRWPRSQARSGIDFWLNINSFPFLDRHVLSLVKNSFIAWEEVAISEAAFRDRGTGNFEVSATDRRNVITFDRSGQQFGDGIGGGVIAFTRINWDDEGNTFDTDIVFNGRDFSFSVGNPTRESGLVDMQDVLTHEIGHLLGLDHSALGGDVAVRPTMYPFFFGEERTLEADDRAGLAALYPSVEALNTGAIKGRVTHRDGSGAFGVHVVAYQADTGAFVAGVLSGSIGERMGRGGDGEYEIKGLPSGDYVVGIEPVDGSVTARNFGGIYDRFDTSFPQEFYDNKAISDAAQAIRLAPNRSVSGVDFTLGTALPGFPFVQQAVLPNSTPDPDGPYRVQFRITDEDNISSASIDYRVNGGSTRTLLLQPEAGQFFFADFPGQARGSSITYRVRAKDGRGNETVFPPAEVPELQFDVLSLSGEPVVYVALRRSRRLVVYDTGLEREVARLPLGVDPLSVLLTPDERYLYVANNGTDEDGTDNKLMMVDTATHQVSVIRVGSEPLDLAVSQSGSRVYVSNSMGQSVSVVEVGGLRELQRISTRVNSTTGRGPFGIAVSPDESRLYAADIDGDQVMVVNLASGQLLRRIDVPTSPRSLVLSPSGDRLYVSRFGENGNGSGISVIDTETGQVVGKVDLGASSIFRMALSPNGTRLYATDRGNSKLLVIDTAQNRVVSSWAAQGRETRDVAISTDGRTVYVANQDSNELLIYDAVTGQLLKSVEMVDGPRGIAVRGRPVYEAALLADAKLADFDGDGQIGFSDFVLFVRVFGTRSGDALFQTAFDLNGDDQVSFSDFVLFAGVYGQVVKG